jgi:hypothetical protein
MKAETVTNHVWIPSLSAEHLAERAAKIRPIIRFAEGSKGYFVNCHGFPCYIYSVNIHTRTYLSKPRYLQRAFGLKHLCNIKTFHPFSSVLSFLPSIADVLAAIPEKIIPRVVAFEIVELLENEEALAAGYHVAKTALYKKN